MAEAANDRNLIKCSLCLEPYTDPRKLTCCGHSFCETCILTYITSLKDNGGLVTEICCPVCRVINPGPGAVNAASQWVKFLEKDVTVPVKMEGNRDVAIQDMCCSCKTLGRTTKATLYCLDCSEVLCKPCSEGRHSYKPLVQHTRIITEPNSGDNSIKSSVLEKISEYTSCTIHSGEMITFFCKDDGDFCCATCVLMNHRKCMHMTEIKELASEKEVEALSKTVKDLILKFLVYAKNVIETMNGSVSENKKQVKKVRLGLRNMRDKINKILDSLEDVTNGRATSLAKKAEMTTNENTDTLNAMVNLFTEYKAFMEKLEAYGSLSHRYITAKRLEELIRDHEAVIFKITSTLKSTKLSLKLETMLQGFLNLDFKNIESLASIKEIPNDISLQPYDGALSMRKYNTKATEKRVAGTYQGYSRTYSSITFLPNKYLVLTDTDNGYCLLATEEGEVVSYCDFKSSGTRRGIDIFCVTYIKDSIIAVSLPDLKKICFVSTDHKLRITNTIVAKYKPKAIQGLKTGDIAVAWCEPVAFGIVSVDEDQPEKLYFSKDKYGRVIKSFDYMAVDEKRSHVIQPCSQDNAIYCFDFEGTPKFKYTDTNYAKPKGVALDRNGNIYSCSCFSHVIHVISPTGVAIQVIEEGVPENPLAVAFRKDGEKFAVTHPTSVWSGVVTFFSLQMPNQP